MALHKWIESIMLLRDTIVKTLYTHYDHVYVQVHTVWNGHHKMDFDEDWKIKHENYYLIYVCVWW